VTPILRPHIEARSLQRNISLYPWFQACRSLLLWQGVWFLYFQDVLSGAEALLLAAIYDIGTLILEVPSGYFSDRVGRRITLIIATLASLAGCLLLGFGDSFLVFALAQVMLGTGTAFASGTDNALLYDSLVATGEEHRVADHEARAWRFTFTALAASALAGGLIAMTAMHLTYLWTALGTAAAFLLVLMFREPPHAGEGFSPVNQARAITARLLHPGLAWLFVLTVAMYAFSHVPFVFAQPFIKDVLTGIGQSAETPLVSGAIVASMMLTSVAAAWFTVPLSRRLGTTGLLLLAISMQVALIAVLAFAVHPAALALLLLRMVPDAFAKPIILAYVQPRI
jgi:predicted MFS family arabinose efflux permease